MEKITLRDLEIGEKFYPASKRDKATPIYQVHGDPEFNRGHGSATRRCINLASNYFENKSCRLEVVRYGKKKFKVSSTDLPTENKTEACINPLVSGSANPDKCRYCNEKEIVEDGCCVDCYKEHCR